MISQPIDVFDKLFQTKIFQLLYHCTMTVPLIHAQIIVRKSLLLNCLTQQKKPVLKCQA